MPLRSRCWCEAEGITLYAKLINASEGGVFIGTYAPLRTGSPAKVRFTLDDPGQEVAADAIVVWVREAAADPRSSPGMGLRFTAIDSASSDALKGFVAKQFSAAAGHA
ncbi:MAG: TIGR02266 family protein [Deltaproteobacteria bacterium]|nr:TIGR02266 family protein [Deltaproteobacteria bacterium]